jgi:uncharacterized protein YcnI
MTRERRTISMVAAALALVVYATNAYAHAVVFPKRAEPGAYEKYVLRVPNERDKATIKVELHFPDSVKVVSFGDVAGWKLDVQLDSAKRIIAATWTGNLPVQRFIEFPFVAVNPKSTTQLVWPAFQTYADGERVEWTGPEGSDKPASVTVIATGPASAPATSPGAAGMADATPADEGGKFATPLAIVAILISMIALGLAMRKNKGDRI